MGVYCEMILENPQLIYQPGDVVSGRIVLTLHERGLIKAVAIKISGYALTRWEKPVKEKKTKKNKTVVDPETAKPKEIYSNREDYLSTTNYFIGSDAAVAKIVEAGVFHFNFAVRLPLNCASIFESAYGHIRYEMNVFIDYPEYRQSCYLRNFHVSRPFDLKKIPDLNQPFNMELIEKKSFVKFWQRPLQLHINVPQTGYIPGEIISVHVKVLNYDLLTLTDITYKLNLVATYVGMLKKKAKMHITRTNVTATVHSLFGQNANVVQHLQNIHVPETPPTLGIAECRCIQISYEIEVHVSSSEKSRAISALMPITIGTIPLQSPLANELTGSAPTLTAARSMDNLLVDKVEPTAEFAVPTAPSEDEAPPYSPMNPVAPTSSFREADFMPSTSFNKRRWLTKSMENLEDFKPKYLYYEIPDTCHENVQMECEDGRTFVDMGKC